MSETNILENYQKIKKIRIEQKMTQTELAKKANISFKTVNRFENGIKISLSSERKILDVLGITENKLYTSLEKNKNSFARQAKNYNKFKFITNINIIKKIINIGYPYNNKRVLDLACGTGTIAIELAKYAKIVDALDISEVMIKNLKNYIKQSRIKNIYCSIGDAHNLKYENDTFDIIVTKLSFHHFDNPNIVISELKRVLKPFGELIVVDIIGSEDNLNLSIQNSINKIRDFSHNNFFTLNELKNFLKENDFINLKIDFWKEKRNFKDWISLANYTDNDNILFNILKGFAINNIKLDLNLKLVKEEISFEQKMVLIKVTNIK